MKILITGGKGYIARSLEKGLRVVHDIKTVTRNDFDMVDKDAMSKWFGDQYFDVVIHAASVGGSRLKAEDSSVVQQNLTMHHNLLSNKKHFAKFISFGSGAEIFATETPYGRSKKAIADSIRATDGCHTLRIFAVFDENELDTRFIKASMLRYLNRQEMVIHANKIMDFFYMQDLVALVDYYITTENLPKEIDCSYRERYTLIEIAHLINELSDYRVPIRIEETEKLGVYCGDDNPLPINTIGLREGIFRTFKILRERTHYENPIL
jgi:GDP-L-fucose synthase